MLILVMMALGIGVGLFLPEKWQKWNGRIQTLCIGLLVFAMGVKLGSRPNLWSELAELGWDSILLGVIPTVLSVIVVYPLTRLFLVKRREGQGR